MEIRMKILEIRMEMHIQPLSAKAAPTYKSVEFFTQMMK
jgi:hypothetical protein